LKYLEEKGRKVNVSDQTLSVAMSKLVVLEKEKCEGLHEDIKWRGAQIKRKHHSNLRGYRIDFLGESKEKAFMILANIVAKESKSAEEDFDENVIDMIQGNKPFLGLQLQIVMLLRLYTTYFFGRRKRKNAAAVATS
jgi:hypothetical protein